MTGSFASGQQIKMNTSQRFLLWIVSILAIVAGLYLLTPMLYQNRIAESETIDHDDEDESVAQHQFALSVEVSEAAQQMASIKSQTLMETFFTPEMRALATVIPTQPLQLAHVRCSEAEMQYRLAEVNVQGMRKELTRLKTLQQATGSLASKEIQFAETNLSVAQAEAELKQQLIQHCHNEIRQQWPQPIADWAIQGGDDFKLLMAREQSLLQVTLPSHKTLDDKVTTIRWQEANKENHVGQAQRLAPSLTADPVLSGETWFFLTQSSSLREGARLQVWVPDDEGTFSGVMIPFHAVVWYAGQPWAYLKMDDEHFQRISLADGLSSVEGIYLQQGFYPGDEVVISGAQTLLSEEFKWQIHDEDDDDD